MSVASIGSTDRAGLVRIAISGLIGRLRTSLFVFPMLCIAGAVGLGEAVVAFDRRLGQGIGDLPLSFTSTVESARAVVSTIAGATITVAGIAFSISILMFQLASSQYSPRVIHGLFRDPFNKRVMGLVAGIFTYCLIVLRSIRSAIDDNGEAVIPNVSVALAVVLGITALLAIVAFINHSAHTMDISRILRGVTDETLDQIRSNWLDADERGAEASPDTPGSPGTEVRSKSGGWVDLIDEDALLRALPEGGCLRLLAVPGDYVLAGQPLAEVWPRLGDGEVSDCEKRVRRAIHVASARSSDQDPLYGLRQVVDVALKALSPGINDPTTAQDRDVPRGHAGQRVRQTAPAPQCGRRGRRETSARTGSSGHRCCPGVGIRRAPADCRDEPSRGHLPAGVGAPCRLLRREPGTGSTTSAPRRLDSRRCRKSRSNRSGSRSPSRGPLRCVVRPRRVGPDFSVQSNRRDSTKCAKQFSPPWLRPGWQLPERAPERLTSKPTFRPTPITNGSVEEYCDLAADYDQRDSVPSDAELDAVVEVAPDEIRADVEVLVESIKDGDQESEAAVEATQNIEDWEADNCDNNVAPGGSDGGSAEVDGGVDLDAEVDGGAESDTSGETSETESQENTTTTA